MSRRLSSCFFNRKKPNFNLNQKKPFIVVFPENKVFRHEHYIPEEPWDIWTKRFQRITAPFVAILTGGTLLIWEHVSAEVSDYSNFGKQML